jgi:uncharacterized protein YejL (UPF0352 family)
MIPGGLAMNKSTLMQQIEDMRAEMISTLEACNSFTDLSVVKISQELDTLLNEYAYGLTN